MLEKEDAVVVVGEVEEEVAGEKDEEEEVTCPSYAWARLR